MGKSKTQIVATPIEDFMTTGKLLSELKSWDKGAFRQTVLKMNLSLRKAYYIVEVYETFRELKIPKEALLSVGWTKLQIIAREVTPANWPYWLAQAEALAVHELKDLVAGKPFELNKHCVLLYLTASEFELLAEVLTAHGATREDRHIAGKEEALIKALVRLKMVGFDG